MFSSIQVVYADTSVYGGAFDDIYEGPSKGFFRLVKSGRFTLVTSTVVQDELGTAPKQVRDLFLEMVEFSRLIDPSDAVKSLQAAYIKQGIVTPKWDVDALHVALATVSRCDLIVSWNFSHIVHFDKIRMYNAVNALCGYNPIGIHSPAEVIGYDED